MTDYFETLKEAYEMILSSLRLHKDTKDMELDLILVGDDDDETRF